MLVFFEVQEILEKKKKIRTGNETSYEGKERPKLNHNERTTIIMKKNITNG